MERLSSRLSYAISIRGRKQVEIANLCNVAKTTVSQWCKGTYEPKIDKVRKIAEFLNVRETWLVGYDVPMEREDSPADNFNEMFMSLDYLDKGIIIGQMMNMLSQEKYKKGSANIG